MFTVCLLLGTFIAALLTKEQDWERIFWLMLLELLLSLPVEVAWYLCYNPIS